MIDLVVLAESLRRQSILEERMKLGDVPFTIAQLKDRTSLSLLECNPEAIVERAIGRPDPKLIVENQEGLPDRVNHDRRKLTRDKQVLVTTFSVAHDDGSDIIGIRASPNIGHGSPLVKQQKTLFA
jgi:hypothetical protein